MDAHHTGGITTDLNITASQCRVLAKGGSITLKDETLDFTKGVKTTVVEHKEIDDDGADLSDKYRNECDSYGWINRKTFEGHVQDVVLKIRTKDGKVMSRRITITVPFARTCMRYYLNRPLRIDMGHP